MTHDMQAPHCSAQPHLRWHTSMPIPLAMMPRRSSHTIPTAGGALGSGSLCRRAETESETRREGRTDGLCVLVSAKPFSRACTK